MVTCRYATKLDNVSPRSDGSPNKNPSAWYWIPLELFVKNSEAPKTIQTQNIPFGYPPELVDKILLLKILHRIGSRYRIIKLNLS